MEKIMMPSKFSPRNPLRSPRLCVSIWQKIEDLKTEEARSAAADSSAVQNMDDDPAT
jgi:hypothetical protein